MRGFTDSAFNPGSRWRIHDAQRPQPPVVTPGETKTGWPARQKFCFPVYGNNIPGPEPVPRAEARDNCLKTIAQIAALGPAIVIPGHRGPGATRDMRANVLKQYPGLGMEFTLNDRVATYFSAPPAANK